MSDRRKIIAESFETVSSFVRANLDGMNADDVTKPSGEGGTNAQWVLGHIVYWRSHVAGMLGGPRLWGEGEHDEFRGTTKGDAPDSLPRTFNQLREDFDAVTEQLMTTLDGASDEAEALEMASFLTLHEAYHAGQLGLFRRIAGLSGAIGK